ncbi:MAG: TonB-dependent receptor [Bacteroidales bacterium]|nr:TonB-dependent receptor [Bacteroidales bacterium]
MMRTTTPMNAKTRLQKRMLMLGLLLLGMVSYAGAQTVYTYTGTVKNTNGETLPGVNVYEEGTTNGTTSDINGAFKLESPNSNTTLTFSFVGFLPKQVQVSSSETVNVVLEENVVALQEVMVIGYGTQKKSLVTGAISKVEAKDLQSLPATNVNQAIQGRVAGVNVLPNSGSPGAALKVRIRGAGSNGNSDPLYIVDGMRTGDISRIDPSDIKSVEILKDAASAAIYGAEAANGVMIITTKSGEAGEAKINYNFQYGIQSPGKLTKAMNASQWTTWIQEANVGVTVPENPEYNTNWMEEITSNAPMQKHYLSFTGGNDKSRYLVSASYFNQDGIVGRDKSNYERLTFRFNSSHDVKKWLEVGNNFNYANVKREAVVEDDEFGGLVVDALAMDPTTPVTFPNGTLPQFAQDAQNAGYTLLQDGSGNYYGLSDFVKGEVANPLAKLSLEQGETKSNNIFGNIYAKIKPVKNLTFTTRAGIDYTEQRYTTWYPTYWFSGERNNTTPNTRDNRNTWSTWLWENFATYDMKFDKHNVSILAGTSAQSYTSNYLNSISGPMFVEDDNYAQHGNVEIDGKISGTNEVKNLNSYFGRASYNYSGKYMLDVAIRADGSSLFAANNKWGYFPSVAAGWIVTEEDFFNSGIIDFFKVRASWGQNGSLSNLGPDQFRSLITTAGIKYPKPGGGYYTGAEPELLANPELTWETSEQIDLGIDMRFLEGKLTFSADYFNKKTIDLLTPGSPPLSVGNNAPFVNAGDVVNKGFEFELGWREMQGDFKYNIGVNLTTIKNEVTYLNPLLERVSGAGIGTGWTATYFEEGQPIWYFRGYETNGIFQNQAQIDQYISDNGLTGYAPVPGDPIVVNTNGDELINEDDQTYIGDPHPDFLFGANFNFMYKNFDLNLFLQGTVGNDILMAWNRTDRSTYNRPEFFFEDRWTGEGSTNDWFRADPSNPYAYNSDLMVFDGSYLRVKQLQLGYSLPKKVLNTIKVDNLRLYVSLDDYFTITKYPGMDVEAGSNDNNSQGIDRGVYPTPKKFMMGLQISL